jgi:hypothetical protein
VCAGCALDSECQLDQYCDTPAGSCSAKLPNGSPIPSVAGHSPPVDGTCTAGAAMVVCTSGVCEPADARCGRLPGGSCTSSAACRDGGTCNTSASVCELPGGGCDGGCPCTSDLECGGSTWCDAQRCVPALPVGSSCTAPAQCVSRLCQAGRCGAADAGVGDAGTKVDAGVSADGGSPERYIGWPLGCSSAPGAGLLLAALLLVRSRRWPRVARLVMVAVALAPLAAGAQEPEPEAEPEFARAHFAASVVGDVLGKQGGFELRADFAPMSWLDVGAGVVLGRNTGVRLLVALHPTHTFIVLPFLQLRGVLNPVAGGVGAGAGAAAGGSLELGPGRIALDAFFEAVAGPPAFSPFAVGFHLGYELDLWKRDR